MRLVCVLSLCFLAILTASTPAQAQTEAAASDSLVRYSAPIREATLSVAYPEDWLLTNMFEKTDWRPVFAVTRKPVNVQAILEGILFTVDDNAMVFVTLLLGAEDKTPVEIVTAAGESIPQSFLRDAQMTQGVERKIEYGRSVAALTFTGADRAGAAVTNRHLAFRDNDRIVYVFTLVAAQHEAELRPILDRIIESIAVGVAPETPEPDSQ